MTRREVEMVGLKKSYEAHKNEVEGIHGPDAVISPENIRIWENTPGTALYRQKHGSSRPFSLGMEIRNFFRGVHL
jgi:hypothetical protein